MKKVLALAAAAALLLSISACGVDVGTVSGSDGTTSDAILSSVPGEESQTGEESQAPAKDPEEIEAEVDDNLTGLCSFLAQTGGVGGDPVDMAADFIGAVAGGLLSGLFFKKVPVVWLRRGFGLLILYGGVKAVLLL